MTGQRLKQKTSFVFKVNFCEEGTKMKVSSVSEQAGREHSFYAKKRAVQRPRGRKELGRGEDLSGTYC